MIPTPRTPTPFKNALAAQEKMHGPLKMEVRSQMSAVCSTWCLSPHEHSSTLLLPVYTHMSVFQPQPLALLEEDIREVLKQETGADIFNKADIQPDYREWKHNVRQCPQQSASMNYTKVIKIYTCAQSLKSREI